MKKECDWCGESLADGEGWNGFCGSCADVTAILTERIQQGSTLPIADLILLVCFEQDRPEPCAEIIEELVGHCDAVRGAL